MTAAEVALVAALVVMVVMVEVVMLMVVVVVGVGVGVGMTLARVVALVVTWVVALAARMVALAAALLVAAEAVRVLLRLGQAAAVQVCCVHRLCPRALVPVVEQPGAHGQPSALVVARRLQSWAVTSQQAS